MAHALVFHSAADSESVKALLVGVSDMQVLPITGPVPARVQFGAPVVMVWSSHAAAQYDNGTVPALPRNSVVLCLDDTPLPSLEASPPMAMRAQGDGADADRLAAALLATSATPAPPPRRAAVATPRPSLDRPRRPSTLSRPADTVAVTAASPARAKAAARRQAQSASVVLSASAFGALTAVALGSVFPADTIVTPSFASTPENELTSQAMAEQAEAHARRVAATAGFEGVIAQNVSSVTFSADEMQALTQKLEQSDQELNAALAWSDGFIDRLQGLSARAAEAMPAMGAVPRAPSTSASAPAAAPPALAQEAPEAAPIGLRDRFTQVEPMAHAVDRISDIASAAPPLSRDTGA